ncbi:MAG TPA: hypothetical protein VMI75_33890 [Polyangiaceae bacterium]|nr:hypothetical protein [Polyangiaceae bacterium]
MMRIRFVVGFGAAMALLACSAAPSEESAELQPVAPHGPSGFVKIQTRDRSITLFTADHGVRRVSVQDEKGVLLLDRVDMERLPTLDARAYDVVRTSVAGVGPREDERGDVRGDIQGF